MCPRGDLPTTLAIFRSLGRRPPLAVSFASCSRNIAAGFKSLCKQINLLALIFIVCPRGDLNSHEISLIRP